MFLLFDGKILNKRTKANLRVWKLMREEMLIWTLTCSVEAIDVFYCLLLFVVSVALTCGVPVWLQCNVAWLVCLYLFSDTFNKGLRSPSS